MKLLTLCLTIFCLSFFIHSSFAQKKIPFGTPKIADLEATYYKEDSTVPAAYLKKECYTQILYYKDIQEPEGFKAELTYRTRIKIYKNEGIKYTKDSFKIFLNNNLDIDKLSRLTITTYNLENNKVVKTILKEKNCSIDKSNRAYHVVSYAAEDVYIGSIVDIQYSIRTPNLMLLPTWYFQSYIPIRSCFYEFMYPEFIDYNVTINGFADLKQEQNSNLASFNFTTGDLNDQYTELNKRFYASNIPAFKQEPLMGAPVNYIGFLDFNVVGYQIPGGFQQNISYTWIDIGHRFLGGPYLGRHLQEANFLDADIDTVIIGLEQPKEKALAVFEYLQKKVLWNRSWRLNSEVPLRAIYQKGVGSITDVNLLLAVALKKAGLKAFPIALSTRGNGFINQQEPSIGVFNYFIIGVELEDEKLHFLDATDPFGTLDILPEYCLNGQGLRLGEYSNWVNLPSKKKVVENFVSKITLDEEGLATGTLKYVAKDYAAYHLRETWQKAGNQLRFFKRLELDNKGLIVKSGTVKYIDDKTKAVELDLDIRLKGKYKINSQTASFTPVYRNVLDKNPFEAATRTYPIQFSLPIKKSFVMTVEIPKGYSVKSLPQAEIIRLPNKAGQFSYNSSVVGEVVQIIYSYKLNATYLPSSMYTDLKTFYDAILRKQGESIVFKKN